jgi:hypothetical protein
MSPCARPTVELQPCPCFLHDALYLGNAVVVAPSASLRNSDAPFIAGASPAPFAVPSTWVTPFPHSLPPSDDLFIRGTVVLLSGAHPLPPSATLATHSRAICLIHGAHCPGAPGQGPCLFGLFPASGHQKLLQIAKRLSFSASFYKITLIKTVQNQHEHKIG